MQIANILFNITSLGINSRAVIWTHGCLKHCPGCISPEYQYFDKSKEKSVSEIIEILKKEKFDGVTISGGEPFLWASELKELVKKIKENFTDDILVYSGYYLKELLERKDKDINYILNNIAVLVDGPFIQSQLDNVLLRGSKNQSIYVLNKKYLKDYQEYLKLEKSVNIVKSGKLLYVIGVPVEGMHDSMMQLMEESEYE